MSYSAIHNKSKEETSDWWSYINCKQEDSEHLQRTAERQEVTLSLRARDTAGQRERDRYTHLEFKYYIITSAFNCTFLLFVSFFFGLLSLTWSSELLGPPGSSQHRRARLAQLESEYRRLNPTWSDVIMINVLINNMFSHPTSSELTVWVWGGRDKEDDHAGRPDEPAEKTDIWQKPQEKCDLLMKKN